MALLLVLAVELSTPDDALLALGLPPVLAAMWTMSGRFAAIVGFLALAIFAVVFVAEPPNRITLASIGVVGLVIGIVVRLYTVSSADVRMGFPRAKFWGFYAIDSLTRRENQIAQLASQGYTDSEIAADLGISERTVESHLAHVYAKLGVTSRRFLIRMGAKLTAAAGDVRAR